MQGDREEWHIERIARGHSRIGRSGGRDREERFVSLKTKRTDG